MNWYYRTLLSYAPIFFIIISSLIFIYFTTLNIASKNEYLETNKAILSQVAQYTDANLQMIERNISRAIFTDDMLTSFFNSQPKAVFDYYMIQKRLIELSSNTPYIISIYLFNEETDEFLTSTNKFTKHTFGDIEFFNDSYKEPGLVGWSSPRQYSQSELNQKVQVVSLFKYYPYPSDKKGGLVVNVQVNSIINEINHMNIFTGENSVISFANLEGIEENKRLQASTLYIPSEYTGWHYYLEGTDTYVAVSNFSKIWIVCGFIIILLAIIWFTITTHLNYQPIQKIASKIRPYMKRTDDEVEKKSTSNELKLIEGVIDGLIAKTLEFDDIHHERKVLSQRNLFYELLTGSCKITEEEVEYRFQQLGISYEYDNISVIVFEMDYYASFQERYDVRDQYLLKYLIEQTLMEIIEHKQLFAWNIWMKPNQLAVSIHIPKNSNERILMQLCEEYRSWINNNLQFTLTAGIGKEVNSIINVQKSFQSALVHLSYKTVYGANTIIDHSEVNSRPIPIKENWYQMLQESVHLFRAHDQQWTIKLKETFNTMKNCFVTHKDIEDVIAQIIYQLDKELNAHSEEVKRLWKQTYEAELMRIAARAETIDELEEKLISILSQLEKEIENDSNQHSNHNIALKIKKYIAEHYADPNLSQNQVSYVIGISPKMVSFIFQEELDIKFIDYLFKVRFEQARTLLRETDEPIQQIAKQVGYMHVISFHRAFKKKYDLTPGEYRSLFRDEKSTSG